MSQAAHLLPPGSTIGILGGGQLGRMLAIAAARLGYHAHIYCPDEDCPASEVAARTTVAPYEDEASLLRFAASVDAVTYEFENIPSISVSTIERRVDVRPASRVLTTCQHRLREKDAVSVLGIGTAPYRAVTSLLELEEAAQQLGMPCILKTCEMGYDGKGQYKITSPADIQTAWKQLARNTSAPSFILEGYVNFSLEISVIVARNGNGDMAAYPPVQNIHRNHILHQTIAPAPISKDVSEEAENVARRIAEALELNGILAIEMFVLDDGKIIVNELAPRPHNSGHWTLDAAACDQFEQTLRAVCNLPLGSTRILTPAVMTNLIGNDIDGWQKYLAEPNARLHLYGKKEAKPGRKMGHVTRLHSSST